MCFLDITENNIQKTINTGYIIFLTNNIHYTCPCLFKNKHTQNIPLLHTLRGALISYSDFNVHLFEITQQSFMDMQRL